jgi:hypothetical protein
MLGRNVWLNVGEKCLVENGTILSWTRNDLFLWASFAGPQLDMNYEMRRDIPYGIYTTISFTGMS